MLKLGKEFNHRHCLGHNFFMDFTPVINLVPRAFSLAWERGKRPWERGCPVIIFPATALTATTTKIIANTTKHTQTHHNKQNKPKHNTTKQNKTQNKQQNTTNSSKHNKKALQLKYMYNARKHN